jgi:FlaG/FlaF family flagellin (archaellin)
VIGTFVLGLGDQVSENAPQASFSFDFDVSNNEVVITHEGGETLEANSIDVSGDDSTTQNGSDNVGPASGFSDPIEAGSTATYDAVDPGETIRVVWTNPAGGNTNTIARATAPQS